MNTRYQFAKQELKNISKSAKNQFPNDKPAIRQIINDGANHLILNYDLSEHQIILLSNYAGTLHPKN
tara:strand:- start:128 stop:328 length:201 start_codon:yes stop_codon:yes gene_type:complete